MDNIKTACVAFALGCPRQAASTTNIYKYLEVNGWVLTNQAEQADLLVVAGCAVDNEHEQMSIRMIRRLVARKKRTARLVLIGCFAGINPAKLREFGGIIVPPRDIRRLDDLLNSAIKFSEIEPVNLPKPYVKKTLSAFTTMDRVSSLFPLVHGVRELIWKVRLHLHRSRLGMDKTGSAEQTFEIVTSDGCDSECTYCAIRFASGPLRSKPVEKIVDEFSRGLHDGHKTFTVYAQDVGAYGRDIGTTLPYLLERLVSHKGNYRIRLIDLNPCWLNLYLDDITRIMRAHPGVFPELMVPVQSGSDRILGMMKRKCTSGDAEKALETVRSAAPDIFLGTHIMVGFPGETNDDFARSINFIKKMGLDRVDVYKYHDQPGTEASTLPSKIPEDVKAERSAVVYETAEKYRRKR